MRPAAVAAVLVPLWRRRLAGIAVEPLTHVEIVELFVPQHAGEGLPLDAAHVLVGNVLLHRGVEGVRLSLALRHDVIEADEGIHARLARAQPQADGDAAAGRDRAHIESRRFGAFARQVDRLVAAVDDVLVEGVLAVAMRAAHPEYA